MEVFVDVITRTGRYVPARIPTWVEAGVGKVVPFACRYAVRSGHDVGRRLAVVHIEELRLLDWPGFSETCVRDFDTLVVVGSPVTVEGGARVVEGLWLVTKGGERRAYFEARARLKAFENGRHRSAG